MPRPAVRTDAEMPLVLLPLFFSLLQEALSVYWASGEYFQIVLCSTLGTFSEQVYGILLFVG